MLLRDLVSRGQQLSGQQPSLWLPLVPGQPQSSEMSTVLSRCPAPWSTYGARGRRGGCPGPPKHPEPALPRGPRDPGPDPSPLGTRCPTRPSGSASGFQKGWGCSHGMRGASWGTMTVSPMGTGLWPGMCPSLDPCLWGLTVQESPLSLGLLLPRAVPASSVERIPFSRAP